MAKRRSVTKKIVIEEELDERPPRRKRRFLRRLIVLCLLLVTAVAVAPRLIAISPLRDTLLNWQMPVGGWRIQCSQAQLSWIGCQALGNVAIIDPAGNPLFTADRLELGRSLLELAVNLRNLGTVRIVKPTVYIATRADHTNVEDFLAALEKQQQLSAGSGTASEKLPRQMNLEISEGSLRGVDTVNGGEWAIDQINLTANRNVDSSLLTADGTAAVAGRQGEATGRLKFRMIPTEDGRQQLDALAEGLMLEPFVPLLRRAIGESQLTGTLSFDGHAVWGEAADGLLAVETWGRAESQGIEVSGAAFRGDELRSEKVVLPWKLALQNGIVTAEELKLDCDWAEFDADGSLALDELQNLNLSQLPKQTFSLTGKVALAQVAAMLPNALQIREGVRIDSGDLEVSAKSAAHDGKFNWTANARLANLIGRDGDRAIEWPKPVNVVAAWVETASGARLDRVKLTAPFASGDFTTTESRVSGEFQLDLAKLTEEFGQFVDLQGVACRGIASGNLTLTASEGDAFAADADIALSQFAAERGEKTLWEEPQLNMKLSAVGSAAGLVPKSVSTGSLELRGSRDQGTINLLTPVDLTKPDSYSVAINGTGPLDSWAGRLRPWFTSVPNEITGDAVLAANASITPNNVQVSDLQGSVDNLRVRSGAITIDEPHVEFSGDCAWSAKERKLNSKQLQLASGMIAFRSRDLRFEFPDGIVPVMTGDLAFRTDLDRCSGAAGLIKQEATWPRGSASGVMRFATNSEQVLADFTFDAEQLELVRFATAGSPHIVWSEPKLHSAGKAIYNIAAERAGIDNLQIDGQTMQLAGAAQWEKPFANGPITVNGNLQYDPAAVAGLIASYAGPGVKVEGDRIVRFEAHGTLPSSVASTHWSRTWQGTAEAGWTGAAAFGLPISAGKLQGTLGNGQLRIAPLDLAVAEGRLTLQPLAIFDPPPQRILIPAGPLIANVEISPAVSEQMLKYVAPVLAGATRVDGQFSLDLDETQVPLADPKQARAAGKLAVHQLTVMPGPLLADIVKIIQQVQSLKDPQNLLGAVAAPKQAKLLSMNDQQIEFQVVDGRVYHRQLEFIIDDVPIRSTGSVGFDQTLALEINIPIQDRWIDGEDALRGLAGQTLKIPVQGTFQSPRVDQRAIADLTRQLIRNTAGQAIGNEINRQLEKLFQGK
jgi:translocation and assembly module TamB